MQDEG